MEKRKQIQGLGEWFDGLHPRKDEITVTNSRDDQDGFRTYRLLRFNEMPAVEVHIVRSNADPGGIGEVGVSTVAPALCNALVVAGYRPGTQPIRKEGFEWI